MSGAERIYTRRTVLRYGGGLVAASTLSPYGKLVQRAPSLCTPDGSASQGWNSTHREINHGRMDGFARLGESSLVYWDQPDLPFYYSLANTFCLANRWFCSAPCQTYPNRRFLMAA